MTRALIMAAALGAFLAACTEVPDLELGDCGNRVVEAGEDCDGFAEAGLMCGPPAADTDVAGKATACFFVCDPGADALACPAGWECGPDRRCREPTQTFAEDEATTLPFPVEEFAVGDVNGDGYADLVGNQSSRVSMRLGSSTATLAGRVDVQAPEPIGPLLFDRVDNDPLLDVIVPIADGLFTLVGDTRTSLDPVAYASLALNPAGGFRALPVEAFTGDSDRDLEILALTSDGMVFFEASSNNALAFPAQGSIQTLVRDIAVGNIDADPLSEVALAFDKKNVIHICEGRASDGLERSLQVVCDRTVPVENPIAAAGGTRFADVNGDRALDLLVSVTVDGVLQVEVRLNDGTGVFAAGVVSQLFSGDSAAPRANPWPIAVADLDDDNADDYVFSNEIVLVADSGGLVPQGGVSAVKAASDTWSSATVSDINGDERPDIAVGLERADRIDFFLNSRDSGQGVVFNKFTLNLDARPRLLRAGDFDGDLVDDVAFVLGELGDERPNQVAVSFGNTSGSSSPPVVMGSFGAIEVLEPIVTSLGISDFDTITDLAVVFSTAEPATRLANVLRGDSSRRMLSPFFLFNEQEQFDQPQGMVLGNFTARDDEPAVASDLLVISEFAPGFHAWLLAGVGLRAGLLAVGRTEVTDVAGFDFDCALWRAGDLDGVPGDEVVGIDGRLGCNGASGSSEGTLLRLTVTAGGFDGGPISDLAPGLSQLGKDFVNLRSMRLHDMNKDERPDIVALFQGDAQGGIDSAAVVFWNEGGQFDASRRAEIKIPGVAFYDAVPIRFGDATPQLLVLSEEWIFRVVYDAGTSSYGTPSILLEQGSTGRLAASDINGDGLSDIVYTNDEDARVILQIPGLPLGSRNPASNQDGGQL
jgi:hypothetical protein